MLILMLMPCLYHTRNGLSSPGYINKRGHQNWYQKTTSKKASRTARVYSQSHVIRVWQLCSRGTLCRFSYLAVK